MKGRETGYQGLFIASIRLALKDKKRINIEIWGDLFGIPNKTIEKIKFMYKERLNDSSRRV